MSLLWWSLGLLGVDGLLAVAYPTVRDNHELDRTFAGLPASVQAMLALHSGSTLTSPIGYLDSQFFANVLPVMLLVFAIGVAAWAIAGDEADGTLELLLANPINRTRVAAERALGLLLLVAALVAVTAAGMVLMAAPVGLDRGLPAARMVAAVVATALLALAYAAMAFAVGAATGRRGVAVAVASALAVAQFLIEGLAEQVRSLRPLREVSPWHWLLGGDPLRAGLTWRSGLLPLVTIVVLMAIGTILFRRRDLA